MGNKESIRLQVFLSRNGVCSRRKAMDLIKEGRVSVGEEVVREPSFAVDSQAQDIRVDGKAVVSQAFTYILLNKPKGCVTTKEDPFAKRTVLDLLPAELRHLHPVGRLDKDTEGLLLLTNDGEMTNKLTHPRYHVEKVYTVRIEGQLKPEEKTRLEKGVIIDGSKTLPAKVSEVNPQGRHTEFLMTIREGRKRQIRLMLEKVGHQVVALKRLQQGPLRLGDLHPGQYRELTQEEIRKLKER